MLKGENMRKEITKWEWGYNKKTSLYEKSDYRSKFYTGKWEKAWLKEVISNAADRGLNLYDAMWNNYADKKEHMPDSLFKFSPFNQNSIKCIEANAVFMNNPRNFNDPFDCVLCASEDEFIKQYLVEHLVRTDAVNREILTEEELSTLKYVSCKEMKYDAWNTMFSRTVSRLVYDSDKQEMRKGASEIHEVIYQAMREYRNGLEQLREGIVGITSFANINKFALTSYMELWAHYAQNHEGFCVEYDMKQTIADDRVNAMLIGGLLPCNYRARQIELSKRKIYKYIKKLPFTPYEKMEFEKSIILSFLTKSSSWSYENEWRLILPCDICEIYGNMVPFFPIKAIYIGCRMPANNREFLYGLAQRRGIVIYNMNMHEHRFELEGDYFPVDIEEYFKRQYESQENQLKQRQYKIWKDGMNPIKR